MTYINLVKADIDNNGTADVFIDTNLTEDGINRWIDRNCVDRPYFTGWDLTDTGFMINFDMSLDCNRDCFNSNDTYISYMKFRMKDLINAKYMLEAAE